jgi:hypothetical protein
MPGIATERAAATRGDAVRPEGRGYGCEVRLAGGLPVPLGATVAMEWSPPWCHLMVQSSLALIFGRRWTAVNRRIQSGPGLRARPRRPRSRRTSAGPSQGLHLWCTG